MQSTMIMSALANTELAKSADNMQAGEMVETSADKLAEIVGDNTAPQFYTAPHVRQQKREFKKIGRNDSCPCGSGKKYKNCCLNSGKYEGYVDA